MEEENSDISKKEEEEEGRRRRRRSNSAARETLYNPSRALCTYTEEQEGEREKKSLSVPRVSRAKEIPLLTISALQRPPATRRAPTDLISRSGDERHHSKTHTRRDDNDDGDAISSLFYCPATPAKRRQTSEIIKTNMGKNQNLNLKKKRKSKQLEPISRPPRIHVARHHYKQKRWTI